MKPSKLLPILFAIAISGYFLYFAIPALRGHFAADDPMNLGHYWTRGFSGALLENLEFWSNAYRPMGAFFYLPIYRFFGFSPLPYRIAILSIIAINVWLTYRVAEFLTDSKLTAALTATLACAHAATLPIYYQTSLIYDVLAYFFSLLMLFCYIRIRRQGRELNLAEAAAVILISIAALNSKEIAVVSASWVLAYEILYPRPRKLLVPMILVALTPLSALGKLFGKEALANIDGYNLDWSIGRYVVNNSKYLNDLFYIGYFTSGRRLAIAWVLLTALCAIVRKRELWWSWWVFCTCTVATSFALVPRDGPSLYFPLFACALLVAVVVTRVVKFPAFKYAAAAVLTYYYCRTTIHLWKERAPIVLQGQQLTWTVLTQIRDLEKRPAPNSRVIFLSNPFSDFDLIFIAELLWNDPSIHIDLANHMEPPPTPADIEHYDWVFRFDGEKLRLDRSPG